mgnify:CR=1 FL=1
MSSVRVWTGTRGGRPAVADAADKNLTPTVFITRSWTRPFPVTPFITDRIIVVWLTLGRVVDVRTNETTEDSNAKAVRDVVDTVVVGSPSHNFFVPKHNTSPSVCAVGKLLLFSLFVRIKMIKQWIIILNNLYLLKCFGHISYDNREALFHGYHYFDDNKWVRCKLIVNVFNFKVIIKCLDTLLYIMYFMMIQIHGQKLQMVLEIH